MANILSTLRQKVMIFIPYNTPSLKNTKVAGKFRPKTVTKYLMQLGIRDYSPTKKTVLEYKQGLKTYRPNLFRQAVGDYFKDAEHPILLGMHFVRKTRHKFDFNNASHIITDLLTAHQFIEDDNMEYLIPFPFRVNGKWYTYDKKNPGAYIKILDNPINL